MESSLILFSQTALASEGGKKEQITRSRGSSHPAKMRLPHILPLLDPIVVLEAPGLSSGKCLSYPQWFYNVIEINQGWSFPSWAGQELSLQRVCRAMLELVPKKALQCGHSHGHQRQEWRWCQCHIGIDVLLWPLPSGRLSVSRRRWCLWRCEINSMGQVILPSWEIHMILQQAGGYLHAKFNCSQR